MKTISEKFVFYRNERWKKLHTIVMIISRKSCKGLDEQQVREFPRLYRQACADLAEARMLKLSRDVLEYLNNIIGQAHKQLYNFPVVKSTKIREFFTIDLPGVFIKFRNFILLSAFLFFIPMVTSYIIMYNNPGYASLIIDENTLSMMEESFQTDIGDRSWSINTSMVSFYIQHNTSIAFASFALGILAGLGTAYILIYNGIALGTIAGYINALGYGANFWRFVCAHSVMELTGLVVAGAAGLMLGYAIIKATRYRRQDWLNLQKKNILLLLACATLLIGCAALIEGLLSPTGISFFARAGVAAGCLFLIISYFLIYPLLGREVKRAT